MYIYTYADYIDIYIHYIDIHFNIKHILLLAQTDLQHKIKFTLRSHKQKWYISLYYALEMFPSEGKKQVNAKVWRLDPSTKHQFKMILTLLVYLAISAATSAEAVGMYTSVATGDDVAVVLKLDAAIMAAEAGLLDTRVTADVVVTGGVSFC